jgi:hypothetical protein
VHVIAIVVAALGIPSAAYPAEATFQIFSEIGEGQYEIYEVTVEVKENAKGKLCYATTLDLDDKIIEKVAEANVQGKKLRANLIPRSRYECGTFSTFSSGWFKVPISIRSDIGVEKYDFIFIGSIEPKLMSGQIYQFREFRPQGDNSVYRSIGVVDVNAKP